jgi:hypothetical protein
VSYSNIPKQATFPKNNLVIAENSYRILKNGVFANGKNIFCDEFNSSAGKNATLNAGSTTSSYNSSNDYYGTPEIVLGSDSTGNSTTSTSYTTLRTESGINDALTKVVAQFGVSLKRNCGQKVIFHYEDLTTDEVTSEGTPSNTSFSKTFTNPQPSKVVDYIEIQARRIDTSNSNMSYSNHSHYGFATSGEIVIDTNTIEFNDSENTFCLFVDADLPTGASIVYSISDGTSTISNCLVGEDVDISSLNSGTAKITITENKGSGGSPLIYGYGGIVIR